jgi:hypothetical protein
LRVANNSEFFAQFRDRLKLADQPAGGLAQMIGLSWSIRDGSPVDAVEFTLGMRRTHEAIAARSNLAPRSSQLEITLVAAAMVGAIGNRTLTAEVLAEARRRTPPEAGDALSDWLDQMLEFLGDPHHSQNGLRGSFGTYLSQLGAAIATGARPNTSPQWLFFCTAIWIDNLAEEGVPSPAGEALLGALQVAWRDCIANRRFLMVMPLQTVPVLAAALDQTDGKTWSKIAMITRASAAAVDRPIPDRTAAALRTREA